MSLNWDDNEEELTEIEYRKSRTGFLVHDEVTTSMGDPEEFKIPTNFPIAPIKDRFAAFFIDTLLLFYVYGLLGAVLQTFLKVQHHGFAPYGALQITLTLLLAFFYYVIMESALGATLGKLFIKLRVIQEDGHTLTLSNAFIRNFLRLLDYPVLFLVALISMESSSLHQRLGDRAGKTIVVKKQRRSAPPLDLTKTPLSSTIGRLFSEIIDLFLALSLLYALLLLCRPSWPRLSYWLSISTPLIFVFYYTLVEFLTDTSPGKLLFRRRVVTEHGESLDATSALLRNLVRPIDYLLGYPLIAISKRKQRLGDMLADTFVVVHNGSEKAFYVTIITIVCIISLGYLGIKNPQNFIRRNLGYFGFAKTFHISQKTFQSRPYIPPKIKTHLSAKTPSIPVDLTNPIISSNSNMRLVEFYFASGPSPSQILRDNTFRPGDLIFAFFKVGGFNLNANQEASLSEDLTIEDTEGRVILLQPKVVEFTRAVDSKIKNMLFANHLKLPSQISQGDYRVLITIHDRIADTELVFEKRFSIK